MSSFVWMKVLESAPERYDRGIRMLSGERIDEVYRRIAALAAALGRRVLAGHGAWLLVVNSKGFNVWCAAGGAHLTHHDIISATRVAHLADRVTHREVVLPQLAATGVERRAITEATGFETRWGPVRLADLLAFLDRGLRAFTGERFMRFPTWERQEMAAMWYVPAFIVLAPILWFAFGLVTALAGVVALVVMVSLIFALLPRLNLLGQRRGLQR